MSTDSQTHHKTKIIICLISGAILSLAFAPFDIALIAVLAPALLFYCWLNTRPGTAFVYGYLFGLGMFSTGVNWLHISINLYGGVNLAGSLALTYLLVAFLALYPAFVGYLGRKYICTSDTICLLVILPALWTIAEWCRAWIFTGFPWLNLGYSQIDKPLSGLSPVVGIYGLSWLVCFSAALLVYVFYTSTKKKMIAIFSLVIIWSFAGAAKHISWTTPDAKELSVALVQAAIPQEIKWNAEQRQKTVELYLSLSEPYWGNDLIIWPETAIPAFYHDAGTVIGLLETLTKKHGTDLITGIPFKDQETDKYFNSIITIGNETGIYYKRHLVPFGEYLPFDKKLRPLLNFLKIPMSDFSSGADEKPLIYAAGVPVGVSICYEDIFGEEVIDALPEAGVLVNISNDAWFGDSIAPHQHLQMARMRALETGRYLLRATNTGISAVINEKGNIIARSPQFAPHVISERVQIFNGLTPYIIFGNLLVIIPAFVLLTIVLIINSRKRKIENK